MLQHVTVKDQPEVVMKEVFREFTPAGIVRLLNDMLMQKKLLFTSSNPELLAKATWAAKEVLLK